jgi:hypothetical protein
MQTTRRVVAVVIVTGVGLLAPPSMSALLGVLPMPHAMPR